MASPLDNINSIPPTAIINPAPHPLAFGRPVQPLDLADKPLPSPDRVQIAPLPACRKMRETIFKQACKEGHEAKVQHLLSAAPGLIACKSYCWILQDAARQGHSGIVDLLLEFKKGSTEYGRLLELPLMLAAGEGHIHIVQSLVEKGKRSAWSAADGVVSALHMAVVAERKEVVKLLLKAGADINARASFDVVPPLLHAVQRHDHLFVQWLLKQGADPNLRPGNTGMPPLAWACQDGDLAKIKILRAAGALIDRGEHEGPTPLALAVENRHEEVVRYLLRCGANVNAACLPSQAPLYQAVVNSRFELSRILLTAGAVADLLCEQEVQETPLMIAAQQGDYRIAELLVDHGADIHRKGPGDLSALELAVQMEFQNIPAMLRAKAAQQAARAGAEPRLAEQ